jgi:hypothetical protein
VSILTFKSKEQIQRERIVAAIDRVNETIEETKEEIRQRELGIDLASNYLKRRKILETIQKENNRRVTADFHLNKKDDTNGAS